MGILLLDIIMELVQVQGQPTKPKWASTTKRQLFVIKGRSKEGLADWTRQRVRKVRSTLPTEARETRHKQTQQTQQTQQSGLFGAASMKSWLLLAVLRVSFPTYHTAAWFPHFCHVLHCLIYFFAFLLLFSVSFCFCKATCSSNMSC